MNNFAATIVTELFARIRRGIGRILLLLPSDDKTALRPDSRIRKGIGKKLRTQL